MMHENSPSTSKIPLPTHGTRSSKMPIEFETGNSLGMKLNRACRRGQKDYGGVGCRKIQWNGCTTHQTLRIGNNWN